MRGGIVDVNTLVGAHGQSGANGLYGLIRPHGNNGHGASLGIPDFEGFFDRNLIVGIHDPFYILGFYGYPIACNFNQRFGIRHLFD